jgi:hypothetical protein
MEDAIAAVIAAVDALEAAKAAEVPAGPDAVRVAVEGVLTSEGWSAPVPEVETPAEDASESAEEAPAA